MEDTELLKKINRTKNTKGTVLERKTVPFARPNSAFCSTKVCILQTADNEAVAKQKMFCRMLRLRMAVRWLNAGLVHRGSGECCRACCDPFRKERASQCPNPDGA